MTHHDHQDEWVDNRLMPLGVEFGYKEDINQVSPINLLGEINWIITWETRRSTRATKGKTGKKYGGESLQSDEF